MKTLLKDFRDELLEKLLALIWRQWCALGVAGTGEPEDRWVIDPEALLAITATMARYEARVFDEALDWLQVNGRFINIQRIKTILKKERFAGDRVLAAIADLMSRGAAAAKWKRLAEIDSGAGKKEEPLFFLKDGRPLTAIRETEPVFQAHGLVRDKIRLRGYSRSFRTEPVTNLHLKLRAFFGVNARCEIVLFLLMNRQGHPREIARQCYYYQKTVQDTLVDMRCSGLVQVAPSGREKLYRLSSPAWNNLLVGGNELPRWVCWPPFFSALERIWLGISDHGMASTEKPLLLSSKLRELMKSTRGDIERSGLGDRLSDEKAYVGEEYIPVFLKDVRSLFAESNAKVIIR